MGIRVLVVDDVEAWRHFATSALQQEQDVEIIGEASDGLFAVHRAAELQPDLILLDVGLPGLSGIQACARIRELSPKSKILLMSVDRSKDIAMEGLRTGASGYLIKSGASRELAHAVRAVLDGKCFFSAALDSHSDVVPSASGTHCRKEVLQHSKLSFSEHQVEIEAASGSTSPVHSVHFYDHDENLISRLHSIVVSSLEAGGSVVVVGTPEHRQQLQASLNKSVVTVAGLSKNRLQILDAKATLSEFMVDDRLSPEKFSRCIRQNIDRAKESAVNAQSGVTVFGEMVAVLWSEGKQCAALELERLWNGFLLEKSFELHCAYPRRILKGDTDSLAVKAICDEHSTIVGFANQISHSAPSW